MFERHWQAENMLGECPVWRAESGTLDWVDIKKSLYLRVAPETNEIAVVPLPGPASAFAPIDADNALFAIENQLLLRRSGHGFSPLATIGSPDLSFNDGKCDPAGRFWVGSRGAAGHGVLFRYDKRGLTAMRGGFDVCNGIGFSPDGAFLYLIDTIPRRLWRFPFDSAHGEIGIGAILSDFAGVPGRPDGLAVDLTGRIWCAMWDGSGIALLSPQGSLLDWIPTPCPRPTSCAFGGADLRTLYVTTAQFGLDPGSDLSGSLLAAPVEIPGLPVAPFAASQLGPQPA